MKDPDNEMSRRHGAPPGVTAVSLVEGARRRDPEAWRQMAQLYGPLVYGWCRRTGLPAADADDVLQEVFLTVAARLEDFRHDRGATFRGWLWTITRNKIGDWLRRKNRQPVSLERPDAVAGPDGVTVDSVDRPPSEGGVARRALELIRPEFHETTWRAFCQVVIEGRTPAAVAADLKITPNAVYIARSRVLHRLREVLGEP